MPLTKTGKEVLSNMKKEYGDKKGESVFYATINKSDKGSDKWHKKSGKYDKKTIESAIKKLS